MHLAVCGLHMRDGKLNHQLTSRNATFVRQTKTDSKYAMYALYNDTPIVKPALVYHPNGRPGGFETASITVEVWDVPDETVASFLQLVPSPLGFGTIILDDASTVYGFISEGWVTDSAAALAMGIRTEDITQFGGWREWHTHRSSTAS